MIAVVLKLVAAWLLGSVNGSLVLGRLKGFDIRAEGSGNAGGTNALRTHGWPFALAVVIIDVGKAVVAVLLLPGLGEPDPAGRAWLEVGCAAAAVAGHVFPVFFGFRGGKGMATLAGAYAVLAPLALAALAVVWIAVLLLSGFVGLATVTAALAVPLWLLVTGLPGGLPMLAFALAMGLFVLYTHRTNIARMRKGTEPRMLWLRRGGG